MDDFSTAPEALTLEMTSAEALIVATLQRIDDRLRRLEELVGKYEPMIYRYGTGKWGRYGR